MNSQDDNRNQPPEKQEEAEVFIYKDSGIREKHGYVPVWLWAVVIALIAWGAYYTVKYWTPPPS